MVRESIEECRRHFGVAEDVAPFAEAKIGRDHDAGALVEFAEQMEQQRPARRTERQVTQLVENDEIKPQQPAGKLSSSVRRLFLFQRIDKIDRGIEPHLLAMMLDCLHA